jgi:hypothetical protein
MKVQELIDALKEHQPDDEILVTGYCHNDYDFDIHAGAGGLFKIFVYPSDEEEQEEEE